MTQHLCSAKFVDAYGAPLRMWREGTARECERPDCAKLETREAERRALWLELDQAMTQHLCSAKFVDAYGAPLRMWREGTARECERPDCAKPQPQPKAKRLGET